MTENLVFRSIEQTIKSLDTNTISNDRKAVLNPLVSYIRKKIAAKEPIALNFICTHNSRRSHLSQVWAQTLAYYVGINNINCYSGGTEATALFPVAAQTLKNIGFQIAMLSEGKNAVYSIKYSDNEHAVIGFSKTYNDRFNPNSNFGAIMTCSSADKGCPIVSGADARFPITYEDPKAFDDTPQQVEKYAERGIQIATELHYVMQEAVVKI